MGRGMSTTHKSIAKKKANEKKAFELRKAGYSYPRIAEELKCSLGSAHNYVVGTLNRYAKEIKEEAKEVLEMELKRLDDMITFLWDKVEEGDNATIDRVIKIMDRRARYLGLDAPVQSEVKIEEVNAAPQLDRIIQRLAKETEARTSNDVEKVGGEG